MHLLPLVIRLHRLLALLVLVPAGEDWPRLAALPAVDFTTIHIYERHMERLPQGES